MSVEFDVITELPQLEALAGEWGALAERADAGLFRSPDWLLPWWHAYHQALHAQLHVCVGRVEGELVCVAPFYTRSARRGPGLKAREIRLMGDAGPRPPALDLLVAPGHEERVGTVLARLLADSASDWDVIDLEPLQEPSRARAYLANRLNAAGLHIESAEAGGGARRIALSVAGVDIAHEPPTGSLFIIYDTDRAALRKGLSLLRRLSRLEWAEREEHSPLADKEATQLLEEVTLTLGKQGRARLARLDDSSGEAISTALIVDDGDRATVLAMAVDPEHLGRGAAERLLTAEAHEAMLRGRVGLDVVTGASEYPIPQMPASRQRVLSLRVYSNSRTGSVARTFGAVRRRVEIARGAPSTAAAGARAAWAKIRHAANQVGSYERLHLYRGELWTRGIEVAEGLTLGLFEQAEFDALTDHARAEVVESLELDEAYCRHKWNRGDVVILARFGERPAGIAWCARDHVEVPELGRTLRLEPSESYIHDVFVAPHARGRRVAPAMLEYLARELRGMDIYRSWALIGSDNVASIRAFERAAYAPVADLIYARMAKVDRLIVRPPDPGAKKLLGLS